MRRDLRLIPILSIAAALMVLAVAAPVAWAERDKGLADRNVADRNDDDDEDEAEEEFDEASIFFELNHTDGDLGIHAMIDGDAWKLLSIENPRDREELVISLSGSLRKQGLTELFFESAEPPFNELSPTAFFRRFPQGEYEIEGITIEGDELESTVEVTHLLPAPAGDLRVNGVLLPANCDVVPLPLIAGPFEVTWAEPTMSHPTIGRTGESIVVDRSELVVEREEPEPLALDFKLPPGVTAVEIPDGLTASGEIIKVEVLVREEGGNQTAVESCFEAD